MLSLLHVRHAERKWSIASHCDPNMSFVTSKNDNRLLKGMIRVNCLKTCCSLNIEVILYNLAKHNSLIFKPSQSLKEIQGPDWSDKSTVQQRSYISKRM